MTTATSAPPAVAPLEAASRRTRARIAFALLGLALVVVGGEGVARLHGDRLCVETPGAVYEAEPRFGWRHVPGLAGWVGTCASGALPVVALDANTRGRLDFERPYAKAAGRRRILLLGGDLPEGLGVRGSAVLARMLELRADARRGPRFEVINAGTGRFALDNDLLYFRHEGVRYAPDVVLLVLDPRVELTALSPRLLRAAGRGAPAKPYLALAGETLVASPAPPSEPPPGHGGLLARSQLYRTLRRLPSISGPPVAWDGAPAADPVEPTLERRRVERVARALLAALRDETQAAGARLVVVLAPASGEDAESGRTLAASTASLGIPTLDLTPAFARFTTLVGRSGYLPGDTHWDGDGHFIAGEAIWNFLLTEGLLPADLVPARVFGGGNVAETESFPEAFAETAWRGRHALFSRFIQYGLWCVALVWAASILPLAGRDWLLAAVSIGLVGLLGTPALAAATLGFALLFYAAVERLPPRAGTAAVVVLLAIFVVAPVVVAWRWPHAYPIEAREYFGFATNVALLRFAAYAFDRRRTGAPRRPLREFLAAMFFFPTFVNGPIESAEEFASRRAPGGLAPGSRIEVAAHLRTTAVALARLVLGVVKVYAAMLILGKLNPDIFATGGEAVGHARLWLWTAELYLYFYVVFSGWSDVAIALGALAGSRVAENFRAPYAAPDIADFWNRWHISFGRWLRSYVYIPLGGNRRHVTLNILIVFLVSGLWHVWGALKLLGPVAYPPPAWAGFVLWGLLNGVGVALVHVLRRRRARGAGRPAPAPLSWRPLATFVVVSFFWVPFFLPPWGSLEQCFAIFARLVGLR